MVLYHPGEYVLINVLINYFYSRYNLHMSKHVIVIVVRHFVMDLLDVSSLSLSSDKLIEWITKFNLCFNFEKVRSINYLRKLSFSG